jgi:hypothetical protein
MRVIPPLLVCLFGVDAVPATAAAAMAGLGTCSARRCRCPQRRHAYGLGAILAIVSHHFGAKT